MEQRIHVVVVDDHEVVRTGIVTLLRRETDIQVVGDFPSAEEAIERLEELRPHVVILDHCLKGISGAAASREISSKPSAPAVLMLTSRLSDEVMRSCLSAGARGHLLKDIPRDELADAVRAVARGELVIAPELVGTLMTLAHPALARNGPEPLEPDELFALSLVSRGMKTGEIARQLGVGQTTLKASLRVVAGKLGARDRREAVAVAIRRGVI